MARYPVMGWLAPNAIDMIGKLTRHPTLSYQVGDENLVDGLTMHFLGQPQGGDLVTGYGIVPPEITARYQVGNGYPGFAYTWQVDPDGALYQMWDTAIMTWHADGPRGAAYPNIGWHNVHSRGVLLTGFGLKGEPTPEQIATVAKLARDYGRTLKGPLRIYAHKDFTATDCPGYASHLWIPRIQDAMKGEDMQFGDKDKADLRNAMDGVRGWASYILACQQAYPRLIGLSPGTELTGASETFDRILGPLL